MINQEELFYGKSKRLSIDDIVNIKERERNKKNGKTF